MTNSLLLIIAISISLVIGLLAFVAGEIYQKFHEVRMDIENLRKIIEKR